MVMRKTLSLLLMAAFFLVSVPMEAKIVHLLPKPQNVTTTVGAAPFALGRAVSITDPTGCKALTRFFTEEAGCTVSADATATVTVELVNAIDGAYDFTLVGFPNEGYALEIEANTIRIKAVTETGVIRAAQTLSQLAQGYEGTPELEALTMTDWPAFKFRGFMHDVGRSFISVELLKKQIDILSHFKVNVFHWHLTENQAWRFEVKQYPQLTSAASMTRFAGQYYTQEECKEVQDYAAERGVIIIPEIDMPGHSAAYTRAMGHDMQTDEGVQELLNILDEVVAVFDKSPYIHIGGDEVAITYPNFLETMIAKIKSYGKEVMVWNPIRGVNISNLDVAMTQMWSSSGNKIAGKANIDCRYNYTNHFDVFADLVGIYKSNIYYQERGDAEVPGFISAPWNDRKTPTEADIMRQNNVYANTIASAERAWMGGGKQYIEVGGTTLPNSGEEYDEFADWERRFLFHKDNTFDAEQRALVPYVKQTNVRWRITNPFPNGGDASMQFPPETEGLKDSYIYNGTNYSTGMATGAGIYLNHTWPTVVPSYFGKNAALNQTAYAWTYVYSETARTVGALIEFHNYGRSENDKAPDAGNWDRKGSRIFVNDEEVMPPVWNNTGKGIGHEVDLMNENFTARAPQQINLKAGWNKVFIKLPYVSASNIRLNKWMFTFVLTDTEGKDALEDVIYSPNQCLDENAEQVAALISEIRQYRNSVVGTGIGFYPESVAADLDAKLSEIEATLPQELTAEQRAAQMEELNAARAAFETALATAKPNGPQVSSGSEVFPYLFQDQRQQRYITSTGVGAGVVGNTTSTAASVWKFAARQDGSYDIINVSDGSYISPTAANNTQIMTTSTQPAKGWDIKLAGDGYVIITSGSVQFNQTQGGQSFKLYNWGSGTNTTDGGCRYKVIPTEVPEDVTIPEPELTLTDISLDGTAPFKIADAMAAPILSANQVTVALDVTLSASNTAEQCLFGSSNSTAAASFSCLNAISGSGSKNMLARFDTGGGRYTMSGAIGTSRHKVVLTMTHATGYNLYIDGSLSQAVSHGNARSLGNYSGVDGLYLGGLVTSGNGNLYPMTGTVHSVRFYTTTLSAEQVAALNYDGLISTGISGVAADNTVPAIYDLSGRRVSQPAKGVFIVNGQKVIIR